MGDNQLYLALAHSALAVTSGFAFLQCTDLKYVRVAFGMYIANGVIGVVDYLLDRKNKRVEQAMSIISRWSRPVYLPLIAAEAILFAGFEEKYSYCHLIFPGVYLILTELFKKSINSDMFDVAMLCNAVSLAFSAYTKEDIYGGLCAVVGLYAYIGPSLYSKEYILLLAITNLLALQFFKQII